MEPEKTDDGNSHNEYDVNLTAEELRDEARRAAIESHNGDINDEEGQ